MNKHRLSASVDADLFAAAEKAVAEGFAESVSEWVNSAMRRHAEHDRRMRALDGFIGAYEAEHGAITEAEIVNAARRVRATAVRVPAPRAKRPARRRSA